MAMRIRRRINVDGPPTDLVEGQLGFNRPASPPAGFPGPTDDLYIGIADTPANIRTLVSPARQLEITGGDQTVNGHKTFATLADQDPTLIISAATAVSAQIRLANPNRSWRIGPGGGGALQLYDEDPAIVGPHARMTIDAAGLVTIVHDLAVGSPGQIHEDCGLSVRASGDHFARLFLSTEPGAVPATNPGGSWQLRVGPGGNFTIYDNEAAAYRINFDKAGLIRFNGEVRLSQDPIDDFDAVTKQYVDAQVGAGLTLPAVFDSGTNSPTVTIKTNAGTPAHIRFDNAATGIGPWEIGPGQGGIFQIYDNAVPDGPIPKARLTVDSAGLVHITQNLQVDGTITGSIDDGTY